MPYDPITLLSTLSTIALPPDTQDSLSVSWLDSYRMGFPPMKHYTLCWAHTDRLPVMAVPHKCILTESMGRHNTARHISALFFFGHLILSTDNRLPAMIWNKGTKHEVFLLGSLLSFALYVINLNGLLLQKSQELLPLHVALQIPILVLGLHDIIYNFHPIRLFRKAP